MRREGDTSPAAGHDACWPIRAYRILSALPPLLPVSREALVTAAGPVLKRSLVEDTICAMENDKILEAAPLPHMTQGERRRALLDDRSAKPSRGLRLTAKGARFIEQHRQDVEAGTCPCEWCVDLAQIRAWVVVQEPGAVERSLLDLLATG